MVAIDNTTAGSKWKEEEDKGIYQEADSIYDVILDPPPPPPPFPPTVPEPQHRERTNSSRPNHYNMSPHGTSAMEDMADDTTFTFKPEDPAQCGSQDHPLPMSISGPTFPKVCDSTPSLDGASGAKPSLKEGVYNIPHSLPQGVASPAPSEDATSTTLLLLEGVPNTISSLQEDGSEATPPLPRAAAGGTAAEPKPPEIPSQYSLLTYAAPVAEPKETATPTTNEGTVGYQPIVHTGQAEDYGGYASLQSPLAQDQQTHSQHLPSSGGARSHYQPLMHQKTEDGSMDTYAKLHSD